MKEWGISVLLFVQLQLTVSLMLALLDGTAQVFGIFLAIVRNLGLIVMAVLLVIRPLNFGEYKDFFILSHPIKINYYVVVIALRILLTIGMSALN